MWEVVSIVAAVVVIIWMLDLMDLSEILINKIKGRIPRKSIEKKLNDFEERIKIIEDKMRDGHS